MRTFILVLSLAYYSNGQGSQERKEDDNKIPAETTEPAPCENGLNAELLVLPPVVLGYDGDDPTEDDKSEETTTPDPDELKKEEEKKEIARLLEKLNKYTLKFEGNFDLPENFRHRTTWYTDDTRKRHMADGLQNLLKFGVVQNMLQSTTPNSGNARFIATPQGFAERPVQKFQNFV